MASAYESLPAEIKLAILNNITDIASLKALIHACPITHALYIQDRKRLLTQATLKGLRTKHSNVFKFAHTLDIRLNQMWNRESTQENLEAGLKLLQHHYLTHGEVRDDSVLSLEQCRSLGKVVEAARWRVYRGWGLMCFVT